MNGVNQISRENNFHLIRLLAALQVLILHSRGHLGIVLPGKLESIVDFFKHFPGVPIFFTVSGFLIFWSYDRMYGNIKKYIRNRLLRIYPGLYGCLLITVILLFYYLGGSVIAKNGQAFLIWLLGQLTFFQFYTPDFLRTFGTGVPNGALWTIPVELQFYALVPILMWLTKKWGQIIIWISFLLSIVFYVNARNIPDSHIVSKLFKVSVIPYLFNFCLGILMYINWQQISKWVANKFFFWITIYILYVFICFYVLHLYTPSYQPGLVGFIATLILSICVISFAFSFTSLSGKIVGETDISYGVYIYHIVVVNFLILMGYVQNPIYLIVTLIVTILLSLFSWHFVEKRFLKMK